MQNSDSNQPTLADLLRPVRRRAWLVLIVVAVSVGASLGLSLNEKKQYSAVASFQFQDESHDFGLVGVPVAPSLTPAQLASEAAQTITQPSVVALVKAGLSSPLQATALTNSVTASVDPNASNVRVSTTARTASGAAQLANGFATAAVRVANRDQRASYRAAARELAKHAPPKADVTATAVYNDELGRLRALASIASPAQVTTVAQPPGSPSSPRPLRNALIAAFGGLVLGLLLVYLWDSLDRRLRSSGEIERHLGYPVVGRVRDDALGHSPNADDRKLAVDPIDWEQFRILRHNLQFLGSNGAPRVIGVTSAMPEEGKTTVACFVAFAAAATGKRTLLIECDLRRSVLAQRLGIRATPGLTDFVNERAEASEVLQVVRFTDAAVRNGARAGSAQDAEKPEADPIFRHELVCITAGSSTEHPVEVLESAAFRTMLAEVRKAYDVVILDTPPVLPVVDALEVIGNTEAIVVCGRAAKLTRGQARAGREALQLVPEQPVGLVVTGIKPSTDDYGSGYYDYYSREHR